MQQFVVNRAGLLEARIYNVEGALVAGTAVAVVVTNAAGGTVASGSATAAGTGIYQYPLPAQTQVADLTADWSGTFSGTALTERTYAEIIGWDLFTLAQARVWDNATMADATAYPAATIVDERTRIVGALEEAIGWPPVPKYGRSTLSGNGEDRITLPTHRATQIIAVTVDDVAYTATELADLVIRSSVIIRQSEGVFTSGDQNIVVEYRWGPETPIPDADRVGLFLLRDRLVPAGMSPRALSQTNEIGTVQYALPSARFPFGIPVVDQWVKTHEEHRRVG